MKLWNLTQERRSAVYEMINTTTGYEHTTIATVNTEPYNKNFRPFLALALVAGGSSATFAILAGRHWPKPIAALTSVFIGSVVFFLMLFTRPIEQTPFVYE